MRETLCWKRSKTQCLSKSLRQDKHSFSSQYHLLKGMNHDKYSRVRSTTTLSCETACIQTLCFPYMWVSHLGKNEYRGECQKAATKKDVNGPSALSLKLHQYLRNLESSVGGSQTLRSPLSLWHWDHWLNRNSGTISLKQVS